MLIGERHLEPELPALRLTAPQRQYWGSIAPGKCSRSASDLATLLWAKGPSSELVPAGWAPAWKEWDRGTVAGFSAMSGHGGRGPHGGAKEVGYSELTQLVGMCGRG